MELRLSYDLPRGFVVARDPERGMVLIGGLGVMGVGQMWRKESPDDSEREGYADAPPADSSRDF